MVSLNNQYLYAKGTCNVVVRNIASGDVEYQSNKVQTSQFTTTCDMGTIQAGIGSATVIQIPHNCAANLTLTNADFSMAARAMQVGAAINYNGAAPVCEVVTASGTDLTVTNEPAAPYGYTECVANVVEVGAVNAAGTAYTIDKTSKKVIGFTAENGKEYVVTYFAVQGTASYFNVGGAFTPAIKHVTVQIAVYSTSGTANVLSGTKVGDLYIIIPRMQFSGKADTDGSQTAASTTSLEGVALTYDEAASAGTACADCSIPGLARVMYVPAASSTAEVQGLFVVGGGVSVAVNGTIQVPVKWLMRDGGVAQPDYTAMDYTSAAEATATVDTNGIITGKAAGNTTVTIALKSDPTVKTVANVTVTA